LRAKEAGLSPPAIFVVGKVVALRQSLNWFESRPLFGKTVVVTRTREQASDLIAQVQALGAETLEFPTIRIVPPSDWTPLDQAVDHLSEYHWIFFTSPNGVRFFFQRLEQLGQDLRILKGIRLAVIGPATAKELGRYHLRPDLVPEKYQAEGLLNALAQIPFQDQKVLLPRAALARDVLPEGLKNLGAEVTVVSAYQTLPAEAEKSFLEGKLDRGEVDCLTFTSSSTVIHFLALFSRREILSRLKSVVIACIGPITAQTARDNGLTVSVTAEEFTIPGLVKEIEKYYSKNG
jgi:uroporphyrinogen III methyltransferase/synthase